MVSSAIVPLEDNDGESEPSVRDILREMLMAKVRAVVGDPAEPCSPQDYLQAVIEQMLAGERVIDFMCDEARTMEKADVDARVRQIFDESFGESIHQLSRFYNQRLVFTNSLIHMNVLAVHDKLRSGAMTEEDYVQQIRSAVHFQLGRAGIEFAHAVTGRDLPTARKT